MRDTDGEYVEYVRARLPALRRAAWHLCGDPHRGDDLVQQTLIRLHLYWRRAAAADNTDAYVHRILTRVFLDERRLHWARVLLLGRTPAPTHEPVPDAGDGADDRAVLRAALATLPPRTRLVLVLRFVADRSVDEVAEILGCRPGTVKSQTARALAALRTILGEQADDLERI